ncbi:uncharacterized protein LOC103280269 [Anolis carolinensis]|uniref:Uncharacterized protein n=1 Tax=Anolis carolinensis TaxID=28377 RepID=A0A803TDK8_ANOCA|nr:PREDICTED: uncharacterized protein LOC103280269 [Anolis carolinensis]|eukprot:XP_016852077.1 PREDICTED: uncharacterized protein LOC103280269 [Anolis carolinensis]
MGPTGQAGQAAAHRRRRSPTLHQATTEPRGRGHKMEILDEFDNEYPLIISFCERITPQDFEGQALNYTQKALQDLYAQMEQNPGICERVVRKRKQEEAENASLLDYLKAKFFALLQGDSNYVNALEEMEMEERVEQLKREMKKANSYARAAKRTTWRPPERRTRRAFMLGGFSPRQNRLRALPPMPDVAQALAAFPKQTERSGTSNIDLKQLWAGMSSVNQKSMVDLRPFILNPSGFRPSTLGGGSVVGRMRCANPPRFPPGGLSSPPASSSSSTGAFNTPMRARFKGNKEDENDNDGKGPDKNPPGA